MSQETIDQIREKAEECVSTPIDDLLVNREKRGPFNFENARPSMEQVLTHIRQLLGYPLEALPQVHQDQMLQQIEALRATIEQMRSFDPKDNPNPSEFVQKLTTQLSNQWETTHPIIAERFPYLALQSGDVQRNVEKMNQAVKDLEGLLAKTEEECKDTVAEIKEIIAAAREASAEAGVAHFSENFSKEAKKFDDQSFRWLIASAIPGIAALIVSGWYLLFWNPPDPTTTADILRVTSSKLIVLAILIGTAVWCGGQYRAARHQQTLNKHRANSLLTFRAFVSATENEQIKDAVLLEATHAIFGIGPTGYVREERGFDGSTKIVELMRSGIAPDGG